MKWLLSLLAILPAVYAEPLFQDNFVAKSFNSVMLQLTPEIANYLYSFILVFAISQFTLGLIWKEEDGSANIAGTGAIAAALGFATAFFVYTTKFNFIGFTIPFIVFIVVGMLSLMVWSLYKAFQSAGAAWVASMIASIGLMIVSVAISNIFLYLSYYTTLTEDNLSEATLNVLDVLTYKHLLLLQGSIKVIEKTYLK